MCAELLARNRRWRRQDNGLRSHRSNHTHIQQAVQLFGRVYVGFQVQQNCAQEFNAHQPWMPGPLTNDRHAVFAFAYDENGVIVLSWGMRSRPPGTGEMSASTKRTQFSPPETRNAGLAPGFNITQLEADLGDVAN